MKFNIPQLKDYSFVKPPHMQDPQYLAQHSSKPATDHKFIGLNDIEEGVKLTILADIERDQRLNEFKQELQKLENKRSQDHIMFDRFIKKAKQDQSELEEKYGSKCLELLKLKRDYDELNEKYVDAQIEINGAKYRQNDLETLLAIKNQQIDDLNETLALFQPSSPPDLNAMVAIFDPPALDLKPSADNKDDESVEEAATTPRSYVKREMVYVQSPQVKFTLNFMACSAFNYIRKPLVGYTPDDTSPVRYAFYYGKVNRSGIIGLATTIVLSSEYKVYRITDINKPIVMNWVQNPETKGKRKFGNIFLGNLTGEKGFETDIRPVFQSELGLTF